MKQFLSLENDTAVSVEREHVFWIKTTERKFLSDSEKAVKIKQVQLSKDKTDNNFVSGLVRIRQIEEENSNVKYILTIKQHHQDTKGEDVGNTECEIEVDLKAFTFLSGIADEMVVKHRYYYPVEGSEGKYWEIDASPDGKGGYNDWFRIELEVDKLEDKLPTLPFVSQEMISPVELSDLNEDEYKEITEEMYRKYFIEYGPFVKYTDNKPKEDKPTETSNDTEEESNDKEDSTEEDDEEFELK